MKPQQNCPKCGIPTTKTNLKRGFGSCPRCYKAERDAALAACRATRAAWDAAASLSSLNAASL